LFSHFIPCGVWEASYIFDGLTKNTSDIQPDVLHGDTQAQSAPVYGLAIRNCARRQGFITAAGAAALFGWRNRIGA